MKIVVLAGGISTERDVSLSSGSEIYKALKRKGHQVILLICFSDCPVSMDILKNCLIPRLTGRHPSAVFRKKPPTCTKSRPDVPDTAAS